ncbi:hypothetical protein [Candidatus Stoquefichus massiliensis]|uniref:hypothetical protein n=1 Tax=Candidatus Stoquefichus massiliensis TaxID=1470350 RepID=UPI000481CBA6|nr:hypothetical protein [Candidatus Stoquefichus massiliensis]
MSEIIETVIGSFLFGSVLVLLCQGTEHMAKKTNTNPLMTISKPELLWMKFKPKEKKDRVKGFVLISSWIVTIILFGLVMIYG